ncbi:MAG: IS30 family transposase [Vescimonas sp.]
MRKSCRRKGRRFDIYYCHSYSAWEKGCNENHNRMIRRFFPKGTNFDQITDRQIRRVQDWMNQYPRKSLAWKSPPKQLNERGPRTAKALVRGPL